VDRGAEAVGAPGEPHECWVVVETMPAFELPDYRGIPVRVSSTTVTDEEVDRALEALREERMSYREVTDRPVSAKDWVKVDAEGQLEGRPLAEMEGAARRLARITGQWLSTDPGAFPPGLGAGLVGAKVGETRAVTVTFPEQFGVAELAGRNLEYRATVLAIREPVLPDVDESFCTAFGVRTLDELRAKLREELAAARRARVRDEIRSQVIEHLLSRTTMTLPAGAVEEETRDVVADIVRHAMARGASEEELRRNRERIEMTARTRAEQRLRLRFILERIADAEGITVTDDDLERHARVFAASAGTDPATWLRQMRERGRLDQLRAMLRPEKALDHVQSLARVEEGGTQ